MSSKEKNYWLLPVSDHLSRLKLASGALQHQIDRYQKVDQVTQLTNLYHVLHVSPRRSPSKMPPHEDLLHYCQASHSLHLPRPFRNSGPHIPVIFAMTIRRNCSTHAQPFAGSDFLHFHPLPGKRHRTRAETPPSADHSFGVKVCPDSILHAIFSLPVTEEGSSQEFGLKEISAILLSYFRKNFTSCPGEWWLEGSVDEASMWRCLVPVRSCGSAHGMTCISHGPRWGCASDSSLGVSFNRCCRYLCDKFA